MPKTVKIRKMLVIPIADVLEDGLVVGEWEGNQFPIFAGHPNFPKALALELESLVPGDKLEKV